MKLADSLYAAFEAFRLTWNLTPERPAASAGIRRNGVTQFVLFMARDREAWRAQEIIETYYCEAEFERQEAIVD